MVDGNFHDNPVHHYPYLLPLIPYCKTPELVPDCLPKKQGGVAPVCLLLSKNPQQDGGYLAKQRRAILDFQKIADNLVALDFSGKIVLNVTGSALQFPHDQSSL